MEYIGTLINIVVYVIAIKSIFLGSDFSFRDLYLYGKEYSDWYKNRETWNDRKPNR